MLFPNGLTLKDRAALDAQFNLVSYLSDGSRRVLVESTNDSDVEIVIRHALNGQKGKQSRRTLIQVVSRKYNATAEETAVCNITVLRPDRSTLVTRDHVIEALQYAIQVLCGNTVTVNGTTFDALLRGES